MRQTIASKTPRIEVVDALRGFAVMAILLVHNLEHFIFPVYPDAASQPGWINILDEGVFSVTFSLFAGKAYAIFALLFGLTFYIQYTNQQKKGKDFGYRFLWRLLLWSDRTVFILAIFLLLQPVEWYHYVMNLFNPAHSLPDLGVGQMYGEVAEYTKEGDFWKFIRGNVTLGQKASLFWAIGAGRFLQTAGLFLLGMLIGRKQLFVASEATIRFWVKALIWSAVLFGPLYQLKVQLMDAGQPDIIRQTVGVVMDMWQKFAFTIVLVASFVLLYQTEKFRKLTADLRFYGKMSLTNYISQSIAGAIIYFPFALYLAPYCGYTVSLLIGFAFFLLQVRFCKWWLKAHKQGPLESIWHKLTWIRSE